MGINEVVGIIFIILVMGIFFLTIYCTISYIELISTIKDCNKEFGIGNWTFTEDKEKFTCSSYNQQEFRTCFENGIKVSCE
jgi:hypothetical protein